MGVMGDELARQVIRATAKKVDELETKVLERIDNGTAGVMEVEAVLEFLAQALEAMDSVDTKGDDQVRTLRLCCVVARCCRVPVRSLSVDTISKILSDDCKLESNGNELMYMKSPSFKPQP